MAQVTYIVNGRRVDAHGNPVGQPATPAPAPVAQSPKQAPEFDPAQVANEALPRLRKPQLQAVADHRGIAYDEKWTVAQLVELLTTGTAPEPVNAGDDDPAAGDDSGDSDDGE